MPKEITYCHPGDPSVRYKQFAIDQLPPWATDVQPVKHKRGGNSRRGRAARRNREAE